MSGGSERSVSSASWRGKKSLYTLIVRFNDATLSAAGTIEMNGRIIQCKGFGNKGGVGRKGLVRLPPAAAK